MAIRIDHSSLEKCCKEIIETILYCLPNAYKGTVYRIGSPPDMIAKRIASGRIEREDDGEITWGLPEKSDYNPPGRSWSEYRDEPFRPLEAMAWCVKTQKSWTAENPRYDSRSVRLQLTGVWEDFHHMEPVLVRKRDLFPGGEPGMEYPRDYQGEVLWCDSEYMVVAVIKIHFLPNTIKIGGPETKVIKKLSRSLGTELLSYQLREQSIKAMNQVAKDRLNSCNILGHSIRNAVTKSGLIFSLIKLELSSLRRQWECLVFGNQEGMRTKEKTLRMLNDELRKIGGPGNGLVEDLLKSHERFLGLFLPPERAETWFHLQVEKKWDELFRRVPVDKEIKKRVYHGISELKKCIHLGKDPDVLATCENISDGLKQEWTELIYKEDDHIDLDYIDRVIRTLEDPSLDLPSREKSRKSLIYLKNLAQTMGELEDNTNTVLRKVLNGFDEDPDNDQK